jgi:leucyl-tRNA synthetase
VAQELPYDPHEIEDRWRHAWRRDGTGLIPSLDDVDPADVFYNLVEFPYPSAEGLHVGHVFKYSGADAFGRYQRMRGKAVFQPMGWDAFGIHTENYALKHDQHPKDLTGRTTENFRAQLSRGGMAWDWRYTVDTSKPEYYRWTQWLLVRLFDAGLLYQAEAPVTWCPSCLTVLAREQTENGGTTCERCQTEVTERVLTQWFLRITAYADRLLDGLEHLDWPERAKRMQRQWIGRSEGREIDFPIAFRHEWSPGSAMVTESGVVTVFTTRPDTVDGVTFLAVPVGHPHAGSTVLHPRTGAELPVLEAEYVVGDYGTGAVMGVPAHDERDARFAAAHGLPVVDALLLDDTSGIGRPAVRYRLRDWLISRQRYWGPPIPIVHCDLDGPVAVPEEQLPVILPDIDEFRPSGTGVSPLAADDDFVRTSCPRCGGPARREPDVSDTFVDSSWYFLRYPSADKPDVAWDDDRTRRFLPVDFYAGGPEHVQRHHLYARFVTMALHDLGLVPFEEPFPRIRLGGLIVKDGARMSKSRGNVISPDDYVRRHGSDVLRCALLFSAPWEQGGDFVDDAVAGIERFFARVWKVVGSGVPGRGAGKAAMAADTRAVDAAIRRATDAVERLRFNVAIAAAMELTGWIEDRGPGLSADDRAHAVRTLVLLLAPLAPHLAEELWVRVSGHGSVHVAPWPEPRADEAEHEVELVVQVDGRVRDRVTVAYGLDGRAALDVATARPKVIHALAGRAVARSIHVPDRLVNLVTG